MIKTFEQLKEIDVVYTRLAKDPEFQKTKLGYALKRFTEKNTKHIFTDFNDTLNDMRIDNALTDKVTGAILYNATETGYQYTPEALKNVVRESKRITGEWEDKEFEVIPFICKDIPESVVLTDEDKELLEGVITNLNETI